MVTQKMTLRRITITHPSGYVEQQWAAHCPCPPIPMLFRAEQSASVYSWACRHLNKYHPKAVAQ